CRAPSAFRPRGPGSRTPRRTRASRRAPGARPRRGSAGARHPGAPPQPAAPAAPTRTRLLPAPLTAAAPDPPSLIPPVRTRPALLARLLLGNPRNALAPRQLGGDIAGADAGRGPHHHQMIQHIGAFADERGAVA